ncbi:MAG: glycoside hydrolase family 3, partial [Clostridia bacterium]|nr:glycoside hydrolase family 3 [Clostridia bacterium]
STGNTATFTLKQNDAADINGDKEINAIDASLVLAYYAHTSTGGTLSIEDFIANKS